MAKTKEINLGEDFGAVTITVNGKRIEIGANGEIAGIGPVNGNAMTAISAAKTAYEVGELTKEGIYIGRLKSKDGTERDYFAAPTDAQDSNGKRLSLNFNAAAEYAKNATVLGHNDWTVPSGWEDRNGAPDVLNEMFNNKSKGAFKGTFDETGSHPSGWYWSSSPNYFTAYAARTQRFSDGFQVDVSKSGGLSVRLVRSLAI